MKKQELLIELNDRGVPVHSSWTVPELRSILVEQRELEKPNEEDRMKGLSKLTLEQLVEEAKKENISIPAKPTRGLMMRLLRESRHTPGTTVVPFGRYKGWMYQEVPTGYLEWAIRESKSNPNAHEDLVRLASWAGQELVRKNATKGYVKKPDLGRDPEALAVVPPPSGGSSSDTSWSKVTKNTAERLTRKAAEIPVPTDIAEDIHETPEELILSLEAQLAALKKKQAASPKK